MWNFPYSTVLRFPTSTDFTPSLQLLYSFAEYFIEENAEVSMKPEFFPSDILWNGGIQF